MQDCDYKPYYEKHSKEIEVRPFALSHSEVPQTALFTCLQINYCQSNLHAVDHANKKAKNYIASGVGAAKCARHTIIYPNGVGDLQKGEKFVLFLFLHLLGTFTDVLY